MASLTFLLVGVFAASCAMSAQTPAGTNPQLPSAQLPGKGLAAHDFMYAGEAQRRRIFIQAIEVTPAKQVVWALLSWDAPADLGPASAIQFLDSPSTPEDVHFGPVH